MHPDTGEIRKIRTEIDIKKALRDELIELPDTLRKEAEKILGKENFAFVNLEDNSKLSKWAKKKRKKRDDRNALIKNCQEYYERSKT